MKIRHVACAMIKAVGHIAVRFFPKLALSASVWSDPSDI
jgi:hypothetical protein